MKFFTLPPGDEVQSFLPSVTKARRSRRGPATSGAVPPVAAPAVSDTLPASPTPSSLRVLFALFVVALFSSISMMEIVIWTMIAAIGYRMITGYRLGRRQGGISRLAIGGDRLLFFHFAIVSLSALARVPDWSDKFDIVLELRWIVVLYSLTWFLRSEVDQRMERTFIRCSPLLVLVGLYALSQHLTGHDFLRGRDGFLKPFWRDASTYRAVGMFNMPLTFAYSYGVLGTLYSTWLIARFSTMSRLRRLVGSATCVCIVAGLIAAGVRGAWVAALVTCCAMLLFVPRRRALVAGAVLLLVGASLFLSSESLRNRAVSTVMLQESSNAGRLKIWRGHWALACDYPWLGVGLGQTGKHVGDYYQRLGIENGQVGHAHNNLLEYLAGAGVFGLLAYLLVAGYFLRRSYLAYRDAVDAPDAVAERSLSPMAAVALACLAAQIYFHIGGMTEVNFTDGEVNHALILVWALTGSLSPREA